MAGLSQLGKEWVLRYRITSGRAKSTWQSMIGSLDIMLRVVRIGPLGDDRVIKHSIMIASGRAR